MTKVTTATHTPGPWIAEPEEASERRGIAICTPLGVHATIVPSYGGALVGEDWANARLIAAAPDLLAALERYANRFAALMGDNHSHDGCDPCEDLRVARAAIAKARGEQS